MRRQNQLVCGVKLDEPAEGPARREEGAQTPIGEHPLDKILAQVGIVEAPFLLYCRSEPVRRAGRKRRRF
jgi:hypothetical protein